MRSVVISSLNFSFFIRFIERLIFSFIELLLFSKLFCSFASHKLKPVLCPEVILIQFLIDYVGALHKSNL